MTRDLNAPSGEPSRTDEMPTRARRKGHDEAPLRTSDHLHRSTAVTGSSHPTIDPRSAMARFTITITADGSCGTGFPAFKAALEAVGSENDIKGARIDYHYGHRAPDDYCTCRPLRTADHGALHSPDCPAVVGTATDHDSRTIQQ